MSDNEIYIVTLLSTIALHECWYMSLTLFKNLVYTIFGSDDTYHYTILLIRVAQPVLSPLNYLLAGKGQYSRGQAAVAKQTFPYV